MNTKSIGIIGNGKMAVDCINHMLEYEKAQVKFFIYDAEKNSSSESSYKLFSEKGIEVKAVSQINSLEALRIVKNHQPDFLFSINNFKIIRNELMDIPKIGTINFHNSPLPLYGGVNIPSWVIINGEKNHGVTWHFINSGIDTGDIIAQKIFPIDADITAGRLMAICIMEGISLFKNIFLKILNNEYKRRPQEGKSSYYSLKDFPENKGIIDFNWRYEKIERMVRGLNFLPFENTFVYPVISTSQGRIVINKVSKVADNNDPLNSGKIVRTDGDFQITCADAVIRIDEAMTEDLEEVEAKDIPKRLGIIENIKAETLSGYLPQK